MKFKEEIKCLICNNFIDVTYIGDLRCKNETKCFENIIHNYTLDMCKKMNWFKKNLI